MILHINIFLYISYCNFIYIAYQPPNYKLSWQILSFLKIYVFRYFFSFLIERWSWVQPTQHSNISLFNKPNFCKEKYWWTNHTCITFTLYIIMETLKIKIKNLNWLLKSFLKKKKYINFGLKYYFNLKFYFSL